jgi:sugar lactone lactonase YvrE
MHSERLIGGLGFPEGPRWHRGQLWFSDFGERVVRAVDFDGSAHEIVRVSATPSGLGWLPDGSLLVVAMSERRVLRVHGSEMVEHADLSRFTGTACNDMVVDLHGNAYVGWASICSNPA